MPPRNSRVASATASMTTPVEPKAATGQFYTINEIADLLGVSPRTVRRAIKRGELVAHHFGRAVRVAAGEFTAFIDRQRRG